MLKTCMNCSHYHGCLGCEGYHIHNFCDKWNVVLKHDHSELHRLLDLAVEEGIDVSEFYPLWDDLESGIAECHLFVPTSNPAFDDKWFEDHRREYLEKLAKIKALIDAKNCE